MVSVLAAVDAKRRGHIGGMAVVSLQGGVLCAGDNAPLGVTAFERCCGRQADGGSFINQQKISRSLPQPQEGNPPPHMAP